MIDPEFYALSMPLPNVTTERVRGAATGEQNVSVTPAQFDRWLAQREQEIRDQVAWEIRMKTEYESRYTLGGNSAPTEAQQARARVIEWFGETLARIASRERHD